MQPKDYISHLHKVSPGVLLLAPFD